MDNNMLLPLHQQLLAAHQEIRECNAYSSKFGLVLSETEITDLVTHEITSGTLVPENYHSQKLTA